MSDYTPVFPEPNPWDIEIARLREQERLARYFLLSIVEKYPGVTPLPNLEGLASQASNIVAGLRTERDAAVADALRYRPAKDAPDIDGKYLVFRYRDSDSPVECFAMFRDGRWLDSGVVCWCPMPAYPGDLLTDAMAVEPRQSP